MFEKLLKRASLNGIEEFIKKWKRTFRIPRKKKLPRTNERGSK